MMPKSADFDVRDIYTIPGPKIAAIYEKNKMTVHFQGMSKTLQFPQTVALQGAPTCSIGISPYGLYNRLNDAGRLIMLNQKAVQFASAPFVRIGDKCTHADPEEAGRRPKLPGRHPGGRELLPSPDRRKERLPHHRHAVAGDGLQAREGEDRPPADLAASWRGTSRR